MSISGSVRRSARDDDGESGSLADGALNTDGAAVQLDQLMDETTEIGCDNGEPVSPEYGPRDNAFNGEVKWVQIDIDAAAADVDHLIGAEERFQLAMARQ